MSAFQNEELETITESTKVKERVANRFVSAKKAELCLVAGADKNPKTLPMDCAKRRRRRVARPGKDKEIIKDYREEFIYFIWKVQLRSIEKSRKSIKFSEKMGKIIYFFDTFFPKKMEYISESMVCLHILPPPTSNCLPLYTSASLAAAILSRRHGATIVDDDDDDDGRRRQETDNNTRSS